MIRTVLDRRVGVLEQAQAATLPLWLRRWLGEPATTAEHHLALIVTEASDYFIGPRDIGRMNTDMLAWLSTRGAHHEA